MKSGEKHNSFPLCVNGSVISDGSAIVLTITKFLFPLIGILFGGYYAFIKFIKKSDPPEWVDSWIQVAIILSLLCLGITFALTANNMGFCSEKYYYKHDNNNIYLVREKNDKDRLKGKITYDKNEDKLEYSYKERVGQKLEIKKIKNTATNGVISADTLLNRNTDSKEGIHINFGGKTLLFFKTGVPKK